MKNIKWISITSCISIFLLTLALLTINNTFSFSSTEGKWDVHFESTNESVIIDDTRIDFYNTLKVGETYKLDVDVVNKGNYNAEIYKVIPADLKQYKLEDSDYTLDDFLSYSYNYEEDNNINSIKSSSKVSTFDILKANTKNKIAIEVKYDITKINNEKLEYLKNHDNKLNFSLYLQLNYKQM